MTGSKNRRFMLKAGLYLGLCLTAVILGLGLTVMMSFNEGRVRFLNTSGADLTANGVLCVYCLLLLRHPRTAWILVAGSLVISGIAFVSAIPNDLVMSRLGWINTALTLLVRPLRIVVTVGITFLIHRLTGIRWMAYLGGLGCLLLGILPAAIARTVRMEGWLSCVGTALLGLFLFWLEAVLWRRLLAAPAIQGKAAEESSE